MHKTNLMDKANYKRSTKKARAQVERPPPFYLSSMPEVFRIYVKDFVAGAICESEYEAVENMEYSYVDDSIDIMSREFEHKQVEEVRTVELEYRPQYRYLKKFREFADAPQYRYLKRFREFADALDSTKNAVFRSYGIEEKNITYCQNKELDGAINSIMTDFLDLWKGMNTVSFVDLVTFTDATADLVIRMVQLHANLSRSVDSLPEQYERLAKKWKHKFTAPYSNKDV